MIQRTHIVAVLCSLGLLLAALDTATAQFRFRYEVQMGIDVLVEQKLQPLWGKRIALVTNQTGRTRQLVSTVDVLLSSDSCTLNAILTPEHGYYGTARAGELVLDSTADSTMPRMKGVAAVFALWLYTSTYPSDVRFVRHRRV